jgi:hypothetical protein
MASHGPLALEVPGHTFRFELHDHGGPFVLGKHGKPLADQPGATAFSGKPIGSGSARAGR